LFRGLCFLHYEIGRKYPFELNRYYCIQNNDENNHEKDPQLSLNLTHKNGICLRDVKPSNMVVTFEGNRVSELWLIDFGMALIG
jgi:serine/threonine protein kinase